ncbi:glycosyltransferase family 4 protein [Alienimonas sp. DA493]|uniref:glycosyltransferase family 4 protein n=1 Tax=Alienimonas sp. DA493 TaxID=3373605 RepID=UPI003754422E
MRVLMTADTCGGVWTQAVELCRGLSERGHAVALATSGGLPTDDQRAAVAALPRVALRPTNFKLEWMPDAAAEVRAFGETLLRLCEATAPDVVHLNEFSHGALDFRAGGRRVPTLVVGHSDVLSWHAAVRGSDAGPEWDGYRRAVRAGLAGADLVAAPTAWMLDELKARFGPFAASTVLTNGLGAAPEVRTSEAPADADREPFVFSAGRYWDEGKNVAALGAVAERLDWPVRLAGLPAPDGEATPPAGVRFLGRLSSDEIAAQYAIAGLYCLPAKYEPFGLTPLEAARGGCPLVLGDCASLREVWGDAAAFVPPDDREALARTLNRLIRDPAARRDLAARAARRAARLTRTAMTDAYLAAYRTLTDGPSDGTEPLRPPRAVGRTVNQAPAPSREPAGVA